MIRLFKLTRPDGKPVWVGENGISIEPAIAGESAAETRIVIGGAQHFVRESVDEVVRHFGGDA